MLFLTFRLSQPKDLDFNNVFSMYQVEHIQKEKYMRNMSQGFWSGVRSLFGI